MRFLDISDEVSVNIDKIEAIARVDEYTSEVITTANRYQAGFPFETLVMMLESIKDRNSEDTQDQMLEQLKTLTKTNQMISV